MPEINVYYKRKTSCFLHPLPFGRESSRGTATHSEKNTQIPSPKRRLNVSQRIRGRTNCYKGRCYYSLPLFFGDFSEDPDGKPSLPMLLSRIIVASVLIPSLLSQISPSSYLSILDTAPLTNTSEEIV